ncbi:MAG: hypothetical protein R3E01_29370 [Pirellulaceae bacterium]|nr:hypothetical protein [Planctomycetales bacterium]
MGISVGTIGSPCHCDGAQLSVRFADREVVLLETNAYKKGIEETLMSLIPFAAHLSRVLRVPLVHDQLAPPSLRVISRGNRNDRLVMLLILIAICAIAIPPIVRNAFAVGVHWLPASACCALIGTVAFLLFSLGNRLR